MLESVISFFPSARDALALQSSHPLLRILNLRNTRISVLLEIEEFLVMLYGIVSLLRLKSLRSSIRFHEKA
jgi:hypothetical protein